MNLSPQSSTSVASELDRQCWFCSCQTRGSLDLRMRQGKCQPASEWLQSVTAEELAWYARATSPHWRNPGWGPGCLRSSHSPRFSHIPRVCTLEGRGGPACHANSSARVPHMFRICSAYVPHMFRIVSACHVATLAQPSLGSRSINFRIFRAYACWRGGESVFTLIAPHEFCTCSGSVPHLFRICFP